MSVCSRWYSRYPLRRCFVYHKSDLRLSPFPICRREIENRNSICQTAQTKLIYPRILLVCNETFCLVTAATHAGTCKPINVIHTYAILRLKYFGFSMIGRANDVHSGWCSCTRLLRMIRSYGTLNWNVTIKVNYIIFARPKFLCAISPNIMKLFMCGSGF